MRKPPIADLDEKGNLKITALNLLNAIFNFREGNDVYVILRKDWEKYENLSTKNRDR